MVKSSSFGSPAAAAQRKSIVLSLTAVLATLLAACASSGTSVNVRFASAAPMSAFEFTDANAWRFAEDEGVGCLELHGRSDYHPPHRSPESMALLHSLAFDDVEITVRARQTTKEYAHRDLILVFAWRDAAHFAYAHLASIGDDNAHQIMLVDDAPRRPVTTALTAGVAWGDGWHELRLVRRGRRVEVYFDDGAAPVLVGDVPEGRGRIGVGSFDDTGRFQWLRARSL